MGGATPSSHTGGSDTTFQSTLPVGGATVGLADIPAETDDFNPRSPWGERQPRLRKVSIQAEFQSTLPVGGATAGLDILWRCCGFQSTLPVGGATTCKPDLYPWRLISIHAPRGGSDMGDAISSGSASEFQSTLPVGGATAAGPTHRPERTISIHAPRGGSDCSMVAKVIGFKNFNPRSPWGERRRNASTADSIGLFQSTLPVGGATFVRVVCGCILQISIHAPRGGSDTVRT